MDIPRESQNKEGRPESCHEKFVPGAFYKGDGPVYGRFWMLSEGWQGVAPEKRPALSLQ